MSSHFICIHGHFYQPPRENPWLDEIEEQETALPYHDWNQRITAECYAPNTHAPVIDEKGRITDTYNNYVRLSFNFGPTLLNWMQKANPYIYREILEADRLSRQHFGGHGSALAQAYHHLIMPLCRPRDKRTQVIWGIYDFKHRFGREPEGMWLPETAVDTETLSCLADGGIKFTILSPYQAKRARPIKEEAWTEVKDGSIDAKRPYLCRLPGGRSVVIFFYHGWLSHQIAFGGLLNNGEALAHKISESFDSQDTPQLVSIATDGETFGHHHKLGEMGLAYALRTLEQEGKVAITNYAAYLEKNPPTHEVEIMENTAWSCPHGVERWRSDCGCAREMNPEWNQKWRRPLREALDDLRDQLDEIYIRGMKGLVEDPWRLRDQYIELLLDRSETNKNRFFQEHAIAALADHHKARILKMLELQRYGMMMFTSCGWFFNDISRIETVQILQYAARAIQLGRELSGWSLEAGFLQKLAVAQSNLPQWRNGAYVYKELIKPKMIFSFKGEIFYATAAYEKAWAVIRYAFFSFGRGIKRIIKRTHRRLRTIRQQFVQRRLNKELKIILRSHDGEMNIKRLQQIARQVQTQDIKLDKTDIAFLAGQRATRMLYRLRQNPYDTGLLGEMDDFLTTMVSMELKLDLWHAKSLYYSIGRNFYQSADKSRSDNPREFNRKRDQYERLGRYF